MNEIKDNGFVQEIKTATILSGESLSDVVDLKGYRLAALYMPSAWSTAAITFLSCPTIDGTFLPVYANGSEVSEAVDVNRCIPIAANAPALSPLRYIKLRSGTVDVAVTQEADRVITLSLKR